MKKINLPLPIVYSLFKDDVHMILEEEDCYLKSNTGLSYPLKPLKFDKCRGKSVAYFNYELALGHYLEIDENECLYVYNKDLYLKSINCSNENQLVLFEPKYNSDIISILDYFNYNQVVTKTEIAKVRAILNLKGTYDMNWYAISLNGNPQGLILLVSISDEIISVAISLCLNKGIFHMLLANALTNFNHQFISIPNLKIDTLIHQKLPLFHGVYDNFDLKRLCEELDEEEFLIKDLIKSSLFSYIEKSNDGVLIKSGNLYYATKNYDLKSLTNCIKINPLSKNVLMEHTHIFPLDENLHEVDLATFLKYVEKVPEYLNESIETDLEYVWGMGGHFYLYKVNDEVVGGGVIQYEAMNHCYLSYIFTLEKYRNKGFGTKIVKALLAQGSTLTNKKMMLIVLNHKLIPFYENCGFKIVAKVDFT